jgi:tryptophan-rich sensory protein
MFYSIIIRNDFFLLALLLMKKNSYQLFLASLLGILFSVGVGFLSSIVTQDAIPTWYKGLNKPFFFSP